MCGLCKVVVSPITQLRPALNYALLPAGGPANVPISGGPSRSAGAHLRSERDSWQPELTISCGIPWGAACHSVWLFALGLNWAFSLVFQPGPRGPLTQKEQPDYEYVRCA